MIRSVVSPRLCVVQSPSIVDVLCTVDVAYCICEFLDLVSVIHIVSSCSDIRSSLNDDSFFMHIANFMFSKRFWILASYRSQPACATVRLELERIERFQIAIERLGEHRWCEDQFINKWSHERGYPVARISETSYQCMDPAQRWHRK